MTPEGRKPGYRSTDVGQIIKTLAAVADSLVTERQVKVSVIAGAVIDRKIHPKDVVETD